MAWMRGAVITLWHWCGWFLLGQPVVGYTMRLAMFLSRWVKSFIVQQRTMRLLPRCGISTSDKAYAVLKFEDGQVSF